jgi:hypothetical protein
MARRHSTQEAYARRALLMAGCAGTAQADHLGRFGPAQASMPTLVEIFSRFRARSMPGPACPGNVFLITYGRFDGSV